MILTIPVLLYQLLFVAILFIASQFGKTVLNIAAVCCLIWTATHVFLPLLMIVQAAVVIGSYLFFRSRIGSRRHRDSLSPAPSITDK